MKKQKQEPKEEIPLDHREEREQLFTRKKATKKDDYKRREDLEDKQYWN